MISNTNRIRINRIAAIIGGVAGLADESGAVLYSSPQVESIGSLKDGSDIGRTDEGFYYKVLGIKGYETLVLFIAGGSVSEFEAGRLLEMAEFVLESSFKTGNERLVSILKALLMCEGSISQKDIEYCNRELMVQAEHIRRNASSKLSSGLRYVLITVTLSESLYYENALEALGGMLPFERGFVVVPIDAVSICAVCLTCRERPADSVAEIASTIKDTLLAEIMVEACVVMSSEVSSLKKLGEVYAEAEEARKIGSAFALADKYYVYRKLGISKLVYHLPVAICREFLAEVLGEGFYSDKAANELLSTMQVFLDNNQNVSEASRALYIHRNTLLYRLDKFNKLTGMDCYTFEAGMKIGLALMIIKYLNGIDGRRE